MSVNRQTTDKTSFPSGGGERLKEIEMRQKLVILPKLNNCSGSLSRQWFVFYSCRDPRSGKMVRFRHYDGFTGLSHAERVEHARQLIETYTSKLKAGWTPFTDSSAAIYTDQLEYKTVTEIYGSRRSSNNSIRLWISRYLDESAPGIRHETFLTYRSKLRIFTFWLEKQGLASNDLRTYNNKVIVQFFRYLIDDRKVSGKTIKYYKILLGRLFKYFCQQKLILINPVYDIPPCSRINDQAARPISAEDREVLRKALASDPELCLATKFEFYCGLRPGHEIRELKRKNIDLTAGTIHVDSQLAKNKHDRVVTIPRQFLDELRASGIMNINRNFYIFGRGGIPGPVPISKNKLSRHFFNLRKKLNLPDEYKLYSYKHTGMIEADDTGDIPAKDISNHVGHADLATTSIYFKNKKARVSKAIRENYPDF